MSKFFVSLFFVFIVSCTTNSDRTKKFVETVNIENSIQGAQPNISESSGHNIYGPIQDEKNESITVDALREPVLAIELTPSLYASFAYLSVFRELEKDKIYPNIINTSSFTLLIALLYAKYRNVNKVEWKLFKLLKDLKEQFVFSSTWKEKLKQFLISEFKNKRLEQLKILVTIPTGKSSNGLIKTGNIVNVVMKSLQLNEKNNFVNSPHLKHINQLNSLGVDLFYTVNTLPKNFSFNTPNGFVWGLYTRLSGMVHRNEEALFVDHQLQKIDMLPNLSDLFGSSSSSAENVAKKMKEEFQEWINKNN